VLAEFLATNPKGGDQVTKHWLVTKFRIKKAVTAEDEKRNQVDYMTDVGKFKKNLLSQHSIALRTVYGHGYEVVSPQDQAEFAIETGIKGMRSGLKKMDRLLVHTNLAALSSNERRKHVEAMTRAGTFRQSIAQTSTLRIEVKIGTDADRDATGE